VVALPCLLYSMDLTVCTWRSRSCTADLRPSSVELLWIIDIYGFWWRVR
jgi:DHA2 family multidrug resistance protein-like MFS transporter